MYSILSDSLHFQWFRSFKLCRDAVLILPAVQGSFIQNILINRSIFIVEITTWFQKIIKNLLSNSY